MSSAIPSSVGQRIGAAINVSLDADLDNLDPSGLTIGSQVYSLQSKEQWTLAASTASVGAGVRPVLGNATGLRWLISEITGDVTLAQLAATGVTSGATLIGVNNPAARYDQASLQAILDSDVVVKVDLAASDGTGGTSLVATQNTGAYYSNTKALEAFLQAGGAKDVTQDASIAANAAAIALRPLTTDLASTSAGKGASTIGVQAGATNVEAALAAIVSVNGTQTTNIATNTSNIAANTASIATLNAQVSPFCNEEFFKNKVASAFGSTRFSFAFDDFVDNAIAATLGGKWALNGAPALDGTYSGGNIIFNADADLIYKSSQTFVKLPRTHKWAVGGRMRFASVAGLGGGEFRVFSLRQDGSNFVAVGLAGGVSATKFAFLTVVGGVTKSAVSTISLDNSAFHDVVLYWNGTSMFGSVDGETPVLVTSTATDIFSSSLFERHGSEAPNAAWLADCVFAAVEPG